MGIHNITSLFAVLMVCVLFLSSASALPSVTILSPLNNTYTTENYTYVNLTSTEELNQSLLSWGNSSGFTNVSMTNISLTNWSHNMTDLNISYHTYNYTIWAQNTTGNWSQSDKYFVILNTLPTATSAVIASSDGQNLTNSTLTSSFTHADDDSDANQANYTKWYINGAENSTFANATSILAGNTTKGQNWSFSVKTYDGYNWSSSWLNSSNLTILNSVPIITANATSPATVYTDTDYLVNLTITDADSAVDTITGYVQFYINGTAAGSVQSRNVTSGANTLIATLGSGNFSKNYNLTAEVWAIDGTNNTSKVNLTLVTVNNSAPTISPGLLANNTYTNDTTPFFNWTASTDADGDLILGYAIEIYNSTGSLNQSNYTLTNTTYNYTASALVQGTYNWSIKAMTTEINSSSVNRTFTIDLTNPTYTNFNSSYGNSTSILTGVTIRVWANLSDNFPLGTAILYSEGGTQRNITNTTITNNSYANLSFVIPSSWHIGTGYTQYNLSIWFNDSSGNYNQTSNFTVNVTDGVAPTVTETTDSSHTSPIILEISTSENSSCHYSESSSDSTWDAMLGEFNNQWGTTHQETLTYSSTGAKTVYVICKDVVGNVASRLTVTFTIEAATATPSSNNQGNTAPAAECSKAWNCTSWSACTSSGTQTRTCTCGCSSSSSCTGDHNLTKTCVYTAVTVNNTAADQVKNKSVEQLNWSAKGKLNIEKIVTVAGLIELPTGIKGNLSDYIIFIDNPESTKMVFSLYIGDTKVLENATVEANESYKIDYSTIQEWKTKYNLNNLHKIRIDVNGGHGLKSMITQEYVSVSAQVNISKVQNKTFSLLVSGDEGSKDVEVTGEIPGELNLTKLKIYHKEEGKWVDITNKSEYNITVDASLRKIKFTVPHLSVQEFLITEEEVALPSEGIDLGIIMWILVLLLIAGAGFIIYSFRDVILQKLNQLNKKENPSIHPMTREIITPRYKPGENPKLNEEDVMIIAQKEFGLLNKFGISALRVKWANGIYWNVRYKNNSLLIDAETGKIVKRHELPGGI